MDDKSSQRFASTVNVHFAASKMHQTSACKPMLIIRFTVQLKIGAASFRQVICIQLPVGNCLSITGVIDMPSSLPSSFGKSAIPTGDISPPKSMENRPEMPKVSPSSLPLILAVIALLLSLISVYGVFFSDKALSSAQKAELAGIASDLRSLEQRDITLSVPITTTVVMNKSYPMKDMFPATFEIPLSFDIPIDTNLIAIGPNGQPFSAHIQDKIPVSVSVPVSSDTAFGSTAITLNKEIPVDAKFTSSVKIGSTYNAELDSIISRLESLAGGQNGSSGK